MSHETPRDRTTRAVRAAQRGRQSAWHELVREFTPTLRRIAARFGLRPCDVDDVVQDTWLDAVRGLRQLSEPAAFVAWITTCLRRNAFKRRALTAGEQLVEAPPERTEPSGIWEQITRAHDARALGAAVVRLPANQRAVLQAFLVTPAASYHELAATLELPIGSIGPTRARSLARLRRDEHLIAALARA
jgi:RNA polymerase sigma factor (sigma-70 family)